jgi:opacity protein-like surface antigen
MFRTYLPAVLGLILLAASGSGAKAQFGLPDVYVAVGVGGAVLEDTDIRSPSDTFETEPFPGYALSGAVGLDFDLLRIEGEVFRNVYSLDNIKDAGVKINAGGSFKTTAGMANVFVDIPLVVVTPFVGAGIGYAEVDADDIRYDGVDIVDDDDTVMAWQLRAGLAFGILPLTDMTIGYRYFVTDDLEMSSSAGDVDVDKLKSHILEVGLRVTF